MAKPRPIPTDPSLWDSCKLQARSRYRVWPSPPASAYAAGLYKAQGGRWSGQQPVRKQQALSRNLRRNHARLSGGSRGQMRAGSSGSVSSSRMPTFSSKQMFKFAASTANSHGPRKVKGGHLIGAAGTALLADTVVSHGAQLGLNGLVKNVNKNISKEVAGSSKKSLRATRRFMRKSVPNTSFVKGPKGDMSSAMYNLMTNHVTTPRGGGPSTMAHEVGHAAQVGSTLRNAGLIGSGLVKSVTGLAPIVGATQYARYRNSDPDKAKKWAKRSAIVSALGSVPQLGYELDASRRALKTMRAAQKAGTGYSPASYRAGRKALGSMFGTYALHAAMGPAVIGATVLGTKAYDKYKAKKRLQATRTGQEKRASIRRTSSVYAGWQF